MEMHYFAWGDMGAGMLAIMLGMGLFALGLLHLLFVVPVFGFSIWMHWRILVKMGYSGSWSLLLLLAFVPFFTGLIFLSYVLALWVLAFTPWPTERVTVLPPSAA
jgi:hypothetical protein